MNRILEQVQSGEFNPVKEFTGNTEKFLEVKTALESVSNNLPKDVCLKFVLTKIAPSAFGRNVDNTVRDRAIELGLHILQFVNISILGAKEQDEIFTLIETSYTKIVAELRDSNYPNWDKLWIFILKLCSERLHAKMTLANKLLRVVEVAFRNSTSIEQRLKAYDCWVELINNSSLNMDHMCSAKQIKLLITPMKAKFSRMPIVIIKRCDTFVYLLEKLQDKATVCLKEFLEFCFGPFDAKNDAEKMKQGRSVADVCSKSTTVLLEIIGHSHGDDENCLSGDNLQLYKPLITDENFPSFAELLINSVMECFILLNAWSQDSVKNSIIVKCLWRSLLQFVGDSSDEVKKKCYVQINNSLRKLLERSRNSEYLHLVLANIVDLLIQDGIVEKLKEVVFDVSMSVIHLVDSCAFNFSNIQKFVISCFDPENGSKYDKIASSSFKISKSENPVLSDVWLKCRISIVPENISNLIWPVRHFQNFKDTKALTAKWTKLYTTECKSETMKGLVLQEMSKLFLENPLLSSSIVHFLELISSADNNPPKDFVARFMRLIELVLTLPNLSATDVKKISSIILTYCNQNLHFYKSDNNDEALDKLCGCMEHLVTIHKDYSFITELTTCLKNSQPKNLARFSKRLMSFLEALMLNEENLIANNTRKLIELLETKENEPGTFSSTSTRSLRIINMANVTSVSKRLSGQVNRPKLSSPLTQKTSKAIPSPRAKSRILDSKKKRDSVVLNQDNSADYVKIDTEVKLNVDNLNEHQKEMLKRRREDIPALYQDLTQSQSQDFFTNTGEKASDDDMKNDENEVGKRSPKKRKRTGNDDEGQSKKVRKLSDAVVTEEDTEKTDVEMQVPTETLTEPSTEVETPKETTSEADTETQISKEAEQEADTQTQFESVIDIPDSDLSQLFEIGPVKPIEEIRTEDLFQMTPPEREENTEEIEETPPESAENAIEVEEKLPEVEEHAEKVEETPPEHAEDTIEVKENQPEREENAEKVEEMAAESGVKENTEVQSNETEETKDHVDKGENVEDKNGGDDNEKEEKTDGDKERNVEGKVEEKNIEDKDEENHIEDKDEENDIEDKDEEKNVEDKNEETNVEEKNNEDEKEEKVVEDKNEEKNVKDKKKEKNVVDKNEEKNVEDKNEEKNVKDKKKEKNVVDKSEENNVEDKSGENNVKITNEDENIEDNDEETNSEVNARRGRKPKSPKLVKTRTSYRRSASLKLKDTDVTPEKATRKSQRKSVKRIRNELVDVIKKQMEQSTKRDETLEKSAIESNNSKTEDNIAEEIDQSIEENGLETSSNSEGTKPDEEMDESQEISLRKSSRQTKKRVSDVQVEKKKRKKRSIDAEYSPDDFVEEKEKSRKNRKEELDNSLRKNKKKRTRSTDEHEESVSELLERVDKRIEENRKREQQKQLKTPNRKSSISKESDLPDGNQNKIILSPEKKPKEIESAKKKNRSSTSKELSDSDPDNSDQESSLPPTEPVESSEKPKSSSKPIDVFEFQGDQENPTEVKKARRRRKTMFFNRSDYTIKRRRRQKKDTKDDGFLFHVTADSPTPLSRSPSLRAVPSSQSSETITILITRSPPDGNKETLETSPTPDSSKVIEDTTPISPSRRSRRTKSPNSDDVIESSQVSPPSDKNKRRSSTRNKSRIKQTTIDEVLKPLIDSPETNRRKTRNSSETLYAESTRKVEASRQQTTPEKKKTLNSLISPKPRRLSLTEPSSQEVTLAKRNKRSKSLDKLDFATEAISFPLKTDKPKEQEPVHVNDTSADTLTCETVSNSPDNDVPTESAETLTLSPVQNDTKEDLPGSPVTCETPDRTTELLNNTSDISPISAAAEASSATPKQTTSEISNVRVARLLRMVNSNVEVRSEGRRWFGTKHSSPSRVRKMRMKKEENLDILTFSREVPSPLTVPASGILKRKFNLEDTPTPSPKRKRVNFSDPAITAKKIFIKDSEEYGDIDQKSDSTNEVCISFNSAEDDNLDHEKIKTRFGGFGEDTVFVKDFCDSNLNDLKVENRLKRLLQQLKVPEVVNVFSNYLGKADPEALNEVKSSLSEKTESQELIDQLIDDQLQLEEVLPKLLKVVEKLPDEKLQQLVNEVTRILNERSIEASTHSEVTQKQVEDHVMNLDCDKMNDLIKTYSLNLSTSKRNDFLVDLMRFASSELPVNKEFVNCHVKVLQDFVSKMTD